MPSSNAPPQEERRSGKVLYNNSKNETWNEVLYFELFFYDGKRFEELDKG